MDYKFKTEPYEHQLHALGISHNKENFALFMEMGTGKSKVLVDNIDVAFCLLAINMYGIPNDADVREGYGLVGPEDLPTLNAVFVRECLEEALSSEELSDKGKAIIVRLLANN